MVKSAGRVNAGRLVKDSEVAVRIDAPGTRTSGVKLEDLVDLRLSGDNVLATLRTDVGSFKRGHPFAKLLKRDGKDKDGTPFTAYVVVPFAFARPSVDGATGILIDSFAPSYALRSRRAVRRFMAGIYRKLTDLEGLPAVFVDAAEIDPVPVSG